jgi:putative flippase GtrA
VSVTAFLIQVAILELLITSAGLPKVLAQAISLVLATPVNFIGNKLWSFRL